MSNTINLDEKLNNLFKWYDQNGDGYVTPDDVNKMSEMFSASAAENEQAKSAILKAFEDIWQLMINGQEDKTNEKLGSEDFVRLYRDNVMTNYETVIAPLIDGVLASHDKDGNGMMSQSEFLNMATSRGLPESVGIQAFQQLDTDGSGQITHAEIQQAVVDFFTSADPNAPGHWLLGPPQSG